MAKKAQLNFNTILLIGLIVLVIYLVFVRGNPDFGTMISNMQEKGIYSYILPFILVFAIVFSVIQQTKVLDPATGLFVSLIVALFSIFFFSSLPIVGFLASLFGRLGVILIIFLVLFMVYGFLTKEEKKK